MDEFHKYNAEKPDTQKETLCNSIYMKFKNMLN